MKRPYYLLSNGRLRRKQNTLFFEKKDEQGKVSRKVIPVEDVESVYLLGEMRFNSKLINFLSQKNIPVHFFNYYGYYTGSFYPREYLVSGFVFVNQVQHYLEPKLRIGLAREFVSGATFNILKNLKYYDHRGCGLKEAMKNFEASTLEIYKAKEIPELMSVEGRAREIYYSCWDAMLNDEFCFEKRTKRPPENAVNALISFGNSMVYTTVLSEIYHTQLNPTVSFLHEPGDRRFSLSLDIAEVFKPILVDRMIFKLVNQKMIQLKHFEEKLKACYLNEEGRKIVLKEYDDRLKTTIKHRGLGRNVSYKRLIRLECYKLVKHLTGIKAYKGFRAWW